MVVRVWRAFHALLPSHSLPSPRSVVALTHMNAHSSRSHAVVMLTVVKVGGCVCVFGTV